MDNDRMPRPRHLKTPSFDMAGNNRQNSNEPPHPHPLRQSATATQINPSIPRTPPEPRTHQRHGQTSRDDVAAVSGTDNSHDELSGDQERKTNPSRQSDASGRSRASIMTDAKKWFDNSNNNPTATFDVSPPDVGSYFEKRESSSDDANHDIPLMSPQHAPPYVPPSAAFLPATLMHSNTRSSSSEDYRSVIDDLTIENKRLKEQLKRFQQNANRDVLENEKLFEIKMHGLPRRKKQELEATLRDFAASLGDTASNDSASQRKREKSMSSSKEHVQQGHHHHHHNSALYSSSGSRSKQASNSSSRSRPVDSAYASMSTGANSGASLSRGPFGGSKARASSEQKVERYLKDIPEGLYPHYGFHSLGDKEKKKLIVRRLEQLFTGKIGGRYTRQARSSAPDSGDAAGTTTVAAAIGDRSSKSAGALNSGSRSGSSGDGGSGPVANIAPYSSTPAASAVPNLQIPSSLVASSEPAREARIQARNSGHKQAKSRDNGSASNSNSNGDDAGNGNGNGSGSGHGNVSVSTTTGGNGKTPFGSSLPDQRPTRLLDLDPDRVQVPADNMEYIRHLGLVPPEIGPQSVAKTIDVSPDADGWVYLNLLANLAQLHILNVAPDFIRQAVVEKSTKFQLSPDGQKIRWRGGMDGTKFSSDGGSTGDRSQHSQSTDADDGSDETGQRKRMKIFGDSSASALSSGKKQSKTGLQDSGASSSFQYKPLFVHRNSVPIMTSGEETSSSQESDLPVTSHAYGSRMDQSNTKSRNRVDSKSKTKSSSISNSNGNSGSNGEASRLSTSRSGGSTNVRKRRKSDGVLVYYSGMPFCTDLAGDSSGEASPTTNETSTLQTQESMDEPLQNRPTVHRSSSGSNIPFRPLTDYLSLSRDEWAGLGLLGIGTVGRNERAASVNDNMSSSASFISSTSNQEDVDDDLVVFDYSSATDATSVSTHEPLLEASGINRVFPEDHFALRVTTHRPFNPSGSINNCDDDDTEMADGNIFNTSSPGRDTFSMASLADRVAALKKQTAPVSAAVAMKNQTPSVKINYVSSVYQQREPAKLPRPAMFYPPFSSTSESEEDEDMLDSEAGEEEDESMLASSSVISRRANPHHSVNNASLASHAVMSSGEDGDVEADGSKETMELEDST